MPFFRQLILDLLELVRLITWNQDSQLPSFQVAQRLGFVVQQTKHVVALQHILITIK